MGFSGVSRFCNLFILLGALTACQANHGNAPISSAQDLGEKTSPVVNAPVTQNTDGTLLNNTSDHSNILVTATATPTPSPTPVPTPTPAATPTPALPLFSYSSSLFTKNIAVANVPLSFTRGTQTSCTISPTTLPAGLTLDAATCSVSGTPTAITPAQNYLVTSSTTSSAATVFGKTVTIKKSALVKNNGSITSCKISPALPAGLVLDSTDCTISGTPSANSALTTYTILATYAGGKTSLVQNTPIKSTDVFASTTCTSTALPAGVVLTGCTISGTPTAAQNATDYWVSETTSGLKSKITLEILAAARVFPDFTVPATSVSLTAGNRLINGPIIASAGSDTQCQTSPGSLPAGLSFSSTGCFISGIPTTAFTNTTYTVSAFNNTSKTTFNQWVPIASSVLAASSCSVTPALPSGLTLNTATCTVSGTPTIALNPTLYTLVTGTAKVRFTLEVLPAAQSTVTFNTATPTNLTQGVTVLDSPLLSAHTGLIMCTASLPAGLSLSHFGCTVSGTPSASGSGSYTVNYIDAGGTASSTLTINVNAPTTGAAINIPSKSTSTFSLAVLPVDPASALPINIPGTSTAAIAFSVTDTGKAITLEPVNTSTSSISLAVTSAPYYEFKNNSTITSVSPALMGGPIAGCTSSPALPSGLNLTPDCTIYGRPKVKSPKTSYVIQATGPAGSAQSGVQIRVSEIAPAITYSSASYTLKKGTPFTTTPWNFGGAPQNCTSNKPLPAGLVLSSSDCSISGTPLGVLETSTSYTITATNTDTDGNASATPPIPSSTLVQSTVVAFIVNDNAGPTLTYLPSAYSLTSGQSLPTPAPLSNLTSIVTKADGTQVLAADTTEIIRYQTLATYLNSLSQFQGSKTFTAYNAAPYTGQATLCATNPALPAGLTFSLANVNAASWKNWGKSDTGGEGFVDLYHEYFPYTGQCVLTGTPTNTTSLATYKLYASNSFGMTEKVITLEVKDSQALTVNFGATTLHFTKNRKITAITPTVTGGNLTACNVTPALPAGITLNGKDCSISGTPTALSSATVYTVSANNSTNGTRSVLTQNVALTASPMVITGGTPTLCEISPTALPAGLSFNQQTCALSGTPTALTGDTVYTVTAYTAAGTTQSVHTISVVASQDAVVTQLNSPGAVITYLTIDVVATQAVSCTGAFLTATPYAGGTGEATNPFQICTATQLAAIGKNPGDWNKYFSLQADLDLSSFYFPDGYLVGNWKDFWGSQFTGTFEGNNHTVSNFKVELPSSTVLNTAAFKNTAAATISACAITPTNLPTGLTFSTTDCSITGIATAAFAATTYTITATTSGGTVNTTAVIEAGTTMDDTIGTNVKFKQNVAAAITPVVTDGTAVSACSISPTTLPTGLSFSTTNCTISGTPTTITAPAVYAITAKTVNGPITTRHTLEVTSVASTKTKFLVSFWNMCTSNCNIAGFGFFQRVGPTGVVQNLNLNTASVNVVPPLCATSTTGCSNGGYQVSDIGILVGLNQGTISHCSVNGVVNSQASEVVGGLIGASTAGSVSTSFSNASVTGSSYVGGLIGFSNGTVSDTYAQGSVTAGVKSFQFGFGKYWGGLIGGSSQPVSRSYAAARIYPAAGSPIGGLIAYSTSTSTDNFWDKTAANYTTSAGAETGLTTANMKTAASMPASWLPAVWTLQDGQYPVLK